MEATKLEDVYFNVDIARQRYDQVRSVFTEEFPGHKPTFIARSPGRVNIIGDHIDYSYFPCVPAAISFDVVMAVEVITSKEDPGFGRVTLVNTDKRFSRTEFDAAHPAIGGETWANYFKCSWITGCKYLGIDAAALPSDKILGLRVAITGNVPAGGGLSSSAAFVVTSLLVVLQSFHLQNGGSGVCKIPKLELTKVSATCEQLVGVNSGGMDQAASIYGEKDHALLVSFRPEMAVQSLQLHQNKADPLIFLIANSLAVSAKLETAPVRYNLRVVEVTLAANLLAKKMGNLVIEQDGNLQAGTLYGVFVAKYGPELTEDTLARMAEHVKVHLSKDTYTEDEVAAELGITVAELRQKYMSTFPIRFDVLKLRQRALHVYEETLRVLKFVHVLQQDSELTSGDAAELGALMNASQDSAEKVYENSNEDCEELCKIARMAGSLGSRVTGAGWGGCTVHLVPRSKAAGVREALKRDYYDVKLHNAPGDALVESRLSGGSAIFMNLE